MDYATYRIAGNAELHKSFSAPVINVWESIESQISRTHEWSRAAYFLISSNRVYVIRERTLYNNVCQSLFSL